MVARLIAIALLNLPLILFGQTTIKGLLSDNNGKPIPYANIYLKNSGDGATSDSSGRFEFQTMLKDSQTLLASSLGFKQLEYPLVLKGVTLELKLKLKPM